MFLFLVFDLVLWNAPPTNNKRGINNFRFQLNTLCVCVYVCVCVCVFCYVNAKWLLFRLFIIHHIKMLKNNTKNNNNKIVCFWKKSRKILAEVGFDPTTCGLWAHHAIHCATLLHPLRRQLTWHFDGTRIRIIVLPVLLFHPNSQAK